MAHNKGSYIYIKILYTCLHNWFFNPSLFKLFLRSTKIIFDDDDMIASNVFMRYDSLNIFQYTMFIMSIKTCHHVSLIFRNFGVDWFGRMKIFLQPLPFSIFGLCRVFVCSVEVDWGFLYTINIFIVKSSLKELYLYKSILKKHKPVREFAGFKILCCPQRNKITTKS